MASILLVDDNALRASLRQSVLELIDEDVVRVANAADALCRVELETFREGLRLVVASHPMFGISGPEFVTELRMRMPTVPVLVLSTREDTPEAYAGITGVVTAGMQNAEDLRGVVREILATAIRRTA